MSAGGELTLQVESDAAPRARAFVTLALEGAAPVLVENARLVVTEFVTNAQLHGAPPFVVRVRAFDDGARIEVEDSGRQMLVLPAQSTDSMTGRGLALVAVVATTWGVRAGDGGGKVVWAELRSATPADATAPEIDVDTLAGMWAERAELETEFTVRLGRVPTDLLLNAKRHIDNVVRELTLERAGASTNRPLPPEVAALIDTVTRDFAPARAEIKRQAAEAAARGDAETELVLTLPVSAVAAGERYLEALDEADKFARHARLLTLETPPLHRVFRRWYVESLIEQLRSRGAGDLADEPETFVQVLSREVTALSELRDTAQRLTLLQKVNAELTSATLAEQMAYVIVRNATASLGAASARVYVERNRTLRSIAVVRPGDPATPAPFDEIPVDADLPGPIVFRSGEPMVWRNLAELTAQFPSLEGIYDTERALHVAPLTVGDHRLGVLSISFPVISRFAEDAQAAMVRALADALAQALERRLAEEALRSDRDVVQSLHQVGQAVTARLEHSEVVQTVTDAATTMTGAQFGAFFYNVLGEDGEGYSQYAVSGVSREAFESFPMPRTTDAFSQPFNGEGVVRLDDVTTDPRYAHMPSNHGMPDGRLTVRSYLAVPVELTEGEVIGRLFFGHSDVGVFDLDAERLAVGIAGYAAIALENGRLYDAARRESRAKQEIATALERPLRPPPLPTVPGVTLAGVVQPFGGEGGLGGDFYDAFKVPSGKWFVALGDVSGKGPEAAAITGLVRDTLWAAAQLSDDIVTILCSVNAALLRHDSGRFATVAAALLTPIHSGTAVEAAWAGHPAGLLLQPGHECTFVHGGGVPLGLFEQIDIEPVNFVLPPGATLLLYTDGLAERSGAVLDEADLATIAHATQPDGLAQMIEKLIDAVDQRHERRDDIAVLGIQAIPEPGR